MAKPLRIVLDTDARIPLRSRLLQTASEAPVLVVIGAAAPIERVEAIEAVSGVSCVVSALSGDGRLDLLPVLATLAARGITRVFSEGGPTVAGALIAAGLVDDVLIFTAPRPVGDGVATLPPLAYAALGDPALFSSVETSWIGPDRLARWESLR